MKKEKVIPMIKESLLAVVKGSVNANLFRKLYYRVGSKKIEVLRDGDLSCAVFVSFVLLPFGLIREPHTTVKSTISDMEKSGWFRIKQPRIGAVLLWGEKLGESGEYHKHVGFYIGEKKAISNSDKKRSPQIHHPTFGVKNGKPNRKIEGIYWHKKLNS